MNPDSDTNTIAVELRDIRFTYDSGATWALDGVNLTIRQGERVCLAGPNGSANPHFHASSQDLPHPMPDMPRCWETTYSMTPARTLMLTAAPAWYRAVFQHPEDQIVTTITEDDVAFGPENLAIAHDDIDMRIAMSLDAVDMSGQREDDPTRMSGGQQQRVAIAGMLAMSPEILVLDEPTAMLDPQGRADIMHILDELQQHGTTIILVTHLVTNSSMPTASFAWITGVSCKALAVILQVFRKWTNQTQRKKTTQLPNPILQMVH